MSAAVCLAAPPVTTRTPAQAQSAKSVPGPTHEPVAHIGPGLIEIEQVLASSLEHMGDLMREREQLAAELGRLQEADARLNEKMEKVIEAIHGRDAAVATLTPQVQAWQQRKAWLIAQSARAVLARKAAPTTSASGVAFRAMLRTLVVEVTLDSESNFYVGYSPDVSEGGIFVATYETLRPREQVFVKIGCVGLAEPVWCLAEVAWVLEYRDAGDDTLGMPGMGLRFLGLAPEDRDVLNRFVMRREPLFFPQFELGC